MSSPAPRYASWTHGKLPLPELAQLKRRGEKIVMVTAYDAPSARLADAAGVELILVGDSAAMVVLGHDSTVPASMDEMLMLTRAATRGAKRPLVVADMPFGVVPGLGRARARERDPLREGRQRRRGQGRRRRAVRSRVFGRSSAPASP